MIDSARKLLALLRNIEVESSTVTYKVRKFDNCYELEFDDYLIYFESRYLEIHYKKIIVLH